MSPTDLTTISTDPVIATQQLLRVVRAQDHRIRVLEEHVRKLLVDNPSCSDGSGRQYSRAGVDKETA